MRRWEVSRSSREDSLEGVELWGGEGAIVFDLKMAAVVGVWNGAGGSAVCLVSSSPVSAGSGFFHCNDELPDAALLLPLCCDFGVLGTGVDIAGRQRKSWRY